jgi:imidazolonepropionase-like amidohydrolase
MLELLPRGRARARGRRAGARADRGDEYKRVREVAATEARADRTGRFPRDAGCVERRRDAVEMPITQLRSWNDAPGNPAALAKAGVSFALTSFRHEGAEALSCAGRQGDRARAREPIALAAVTTEARPMLGLADRLGTIAPARSRTSR